MKVLRIAASTLFLAGIVVLYGMLAPNQAVSSPMAQPYYTAVGFSPRHSTVAQGETVTVTIVADLDNYLLGASTLSIVYNNSIVSAVGCTPDPILELPLCNENYGPSEVRFTGVSPYGVSGTIQIGTVSFLATGEPGRTTTLDITPMVWVDVNQQRLPSVEDIPDVDGSINIRQPLPTPTPTPTPTPVPPTATPLPTVTPTSTPTVTPTPALNFLPTILRLEQDGATLPVGQGTVLQLVVADPNGGDDVVRSELWLNDDNSWYFFDSSSSVVQGDEVTFQSTINVTQCPSKGCGVDIDVVGIAVDRAWEPHSRNVGSVRVQ
jgi:hypothetical protein